MKENKTDEKIKELEEEIKKLKKQSKRQKWMNVFLLWSK